MNPRYQSILTVVLGIAVIALLVLQWKTSKSSEVDAQTISTNRVDESAIAAIPQTGANAAPEMANTSTNSPPADSGAATNAPVAATAGPSTNAPVATADGPSTNAPTASVEGGPTEGEAAEDSEKKEEQPSEIQISFKGANVDMVVQWLAKTSGKSVIKHPRVQCQLTIVSSKELPIRDALRLVYNALALEGFTTIESSNSILIVPEGQEPKLSPTFMESGQNEIPAGRQRIVKVFQVQNTPVSQLRDRVKVVLSESATVEVDERGNKLIVTDYTDNIQLLSSLLPELDGSSSSETTIKIYTLKHLQAQELANLLNLVLSGQAGPTSSPSRSSSPSPSSRVSSPFGITLRGPSMPSPSGGESTPSVTPAGDVRFWPDNTSNRLIVSAPKDRIQEVEDLINSLDTEKPMDVGVRVLPLQHVDAAQLVQEIAPLYRRMSGDSLKDAIEVTANERSNSLIVLSSEANFKMLQGFIQGIDNEDAQEKIIQTFPLKNADAEEVAGQLRELNQSQGSSRMVFYYVPYSSSQPAQTKVVADRRRNTVIVQAVPAEMPGIAKMIETLDEPVGDEALAPRIFPLKFVSAIDIEDVLNELFLKKQQQRSYYDYYYAMETGQSSSPEDVGRLYGKVRITSEPYSNSIIVSANSQESLDAVEGILKQLDVPSEAGDSTLRVQLKFADAITIANSLNILFAKGGSPQWRPNAQQGPQQNQQNQQQNRSGIQSGFQLEQEQQDELYFPWLGGQQDSSLSADGRANRPASDLVGRVRVVPDKRSNSILLTANVHYFAPVLKLINELDTPTAQVLIEAKIIEVSSDFRDRLGVRWSPNGDAVFDSDDLDGSFMPSAGVDYTEVFAGSAVPGALKTGILDATVNLDVLIQFLRKNTDATVLAEPQINVSDNELGKLFVGAQVPFISNALTTDTGGQTQTFDYKDVGIILEVTPQINNGTDVSLKIRTESSNIRSGETLFGGAILDTRNFQTDVSIQSGQTVVLGGIIQRQDNEVIRKVPLLGDIPVLGWMFKKKDKVNRSVELMVFLRPRISRSPEEAAQLLQDIERKAPRLRDSQSRIQEENAAVP